MWARPGFDKEIVYLKLHAEVGWPRKKA